MVLQQFFSSLAEQVDAKKREQVRENEETGGRLGYSAGGR